MTLYLPTFDIIVEIHEVVLNISGGKGGIHVESDIHRAVERPVTYTSYIETYDLDTVCAVLVDSIARYHGFSDGNKRTALMTTMMTYRMNDINFKPTIAMNKEFDALVMWVVKKKPEIPQIEQRLKLLRTRFEVGTQQPFSRMLNSFAIMRLKKEQAKRNK
jgi:death-on-curing protein